MMFSKLCYVSVSYINSHVHRAARWASDPLDDDPKPISATLACRFCPFFEELRSSFASGYRFLYESSEASVPLAPL